ncbi:MAG: 2-C-methyl-D-erythritol 4-phosphate cytidylyltransferase [Vampirovibrionales bacterium]|nr:2-C-methyl-D-erythritol 4-phosphate cytidylyltransferase [Vampirovibrionales bacterium]
MTLNHPTCWAILLAGGGGQRFQATSPEPLNKLMIALHHRPVLAWSAQRLLACEAISGVILVCPDPMRSPYQKMLQSHLAIASKPILTATAGTSRAQSVASGLTALANLQTPPDFVLVHDGARPLISQTLIDRVLAPLFEGQAEAVIAGLPVRDTIKKIAGQWVAETLTREHLMAAQTPQAFSFPLLHQAHRLAQQSTCATDDAQLIEAMGYPVHWVLGDPKNLKLTISDDLSILSAYSSGQ